MTSQDVPLPEDNIASISYPRGRSRRTPTTASSPSLTQPLRTRLNEAEKLVLARLCVQYQEEHNRGQKGIFWQKIRSRLKDETGKDLRDPQQTMRMLVTQFEERESKESGTAHADTDLNQALRAWREHEAELKRQIEDSKKTQMQLAQEANEASIHRQNLLHIQSESNSAHNVSDPDIDTDLEVGHVAVQTLQRARKRKRQEDSAADGIIRAIERTGERITNAIEALAKEVSRDSRESPNEARLARGSVVSTTEVRLKSLEEKLEKQSKQNEDIKGMLAELLASTRHSGI